MPAAGRARNTRTSGWVVCGVVLRRDEDHAEHKPRREAEGRDALEEPVNVPRTRTTVGNRPPPPPPYYPLEQPPGDHENDAYEATSADNATVLMFP